MVDSEGSQNHPLAHPPGGLLLLKRFGKVLGHAFKKKSERRLSNSSQARPKSSSSNYGPFENPFTPGRTRALMSHALSAPNTPSSPSRAAIAEALLRSRAREKAAKKSTADPFQENHARQTPGRRSPGDDLKTHSLMLPPSQSFVNNFAEQGEVLIGLPTGMTQQQAAELLEAFHKRTITIMTSKEPFYVPNELSIQILEHFRLDLTDTHEEARLKIKTLHAVAGVSRTLYQIATPMLWENVRIDLTTGWKTAAFIRTVLTCPTLAELIKTTQINIIINAESGSRPPRPQGHKGDDYPRYETELWRAFRDVDIPTIHKSILLFHLRNILDGFEDTHSAWWMGDIPHAYSTLDLTTMLVVLLCPHVQHIQILSNSQSFEAKQWMLQYPSAIASWLAIRRKMPTVMPANGGYLHFERISTPTALNKVLVVDPKPSPGYRPTYESITMDGANFFTLHLCLSGFWSYLTRLILTSTWLDQGNCPTQHIMTFLEKCQNLRHLDVSLSSKLRTNRVVRPDLAPLTQPGTMFAHDSIEHLAIRNWYMVSTYFNSPRTHWLFAFFQMPALKSLHVPLHIFVDPVPRMNNILTLQLPDNLEALYLYEPDHTFRPWVLSMYDLLVDIMHESRFKHLTLITLEFRYTKHLPDDADTMRLPPGWKLGWSGKIVTDSHTTYERLGLRRGTLPG